MPFRIQPTLTRAGGAILIAYALASCATVPSTPELIVQERAAQSWKVFLANDFDNAYGFMPPSYRAVTPLATYKKSFGGAVNWTAAEVVSVECETQDKCIATMKVTAKPVTLRGARGSMPIVTHFGQTWVRESGQWWLFPTP